MLHLCAARYQIFRLPSECSRALNGGKRPKAVIKGDLDFSSADPEEYEAWLRRLLLIARASSPDLPFSGLLITSDS